MFCPNCGGIYRRLEICPKCGERLLRANGNLGEIGESKQTQQTTQNTMEICCPKCGSTNYYTRNRRKHYPGLNRSHPLLVALITVVTLYFLIRGWYKYYYCRDCGHRWRVD